MWKRLLTIAFLLAYAWAGQPQFHQVGFGYSHAELYTFARNHAQKLQEAVVVVDTKSRKVAIGLVECELKLAAAIEHTHKVMHKHTDSRGVVQRARAYVFPNIAEYRNFCIRSSESPGIAKPPDTRNYIPLSYTYVSPQTLPDSANNPHAVRTPHNDLPNLENSPRTTTGDSEPSSLKFTEKDLHRLLLVLAVLYVSWSLVTSANSYKSYSYNTLDNRRYSYATLDRTTKPEPCYRCDERHEWEIDCLYPSSSDSTDSSDSDSD